MSNNCLLQIRLPLRDVGGTRDSERHNVLSTPDGSLGLLVPRQRDSLPPLARVKLALVEALFLVIREVERNGSCEM